jgi:Pectate lyase superfamily protein
MPHRPRPLDEPMTRDRRTNHDPDDVTPGPSIGRQRWTGPAWIAVVVALGLLVRSAVLAGPESRAGSGASANPPARAIPSIGILADLPAPSRPDGPTLVVSGAKADGVADDARVVQAAIAAVARRGGGVVALPAGTYAISHVRLASNVFLRGDGTQATTIRAIGSPGTPTILAQDVAHVGLSDLTVEGRGVAGGKGDEILVNLIDAPGATVFDVHLDRAQGIGLQVVGAGSVGGTYQGIRITNTFHRGNGFHGVGLWLFHGPSLNRISNVVTDISDGPGIMLDAGTTVGTGIAVTDNTLSNIAISHAARQPGAAAIIFAGASRNNLTAFRVTDTNAQDSVAISIQQDQTGVPAEDNEISDGTVDGVGDAAFDLEGSSRNRIHDVAVRNIGTVQPARLIQLTATTVDAGQVELPTTENVFSRLSIDEEVGRYTFGVRLDSEVVSVVRNQFLHIGWGTPSDGIVEVLGSAAPLTGPDANIVDGMR